MKKRTTLINKYGLLSFLFVLLANPGTLTAAPGTLADSPLFLSKSAEPNIFFMVDDSGSMDWELSTSENNGTMTVGGRTYRYTFNASDNAYTTSTYMVPTEEYFVSQSETQVGAWRARSSYYNTMYYDPTKIYVPWPGVDNATTPVTFANASATAARENPYNTASTAYDLTTDKSQSITFPDGSTGTMTFYPAMYYLWDDTTGAGANNGVVDATDGYKLIEIKSTTAVCTNGTSATLNEQLTEASGNGCMLRAYADEIQNFANWWTYFRRREYASKNAVGSVINNSTNVRMGIATLHNDTGEQKEVTSMNSDVASGNKKALLDANYTIQSSGGTPLRDALEETGEYFGCNTSRSSSLFAGTPCAVETSIPSGATEAPGACQQNFAVLMTDGYYNGATSSLSSDIADNDSDGGGFTGTYYPVGDTESASQSFAFDGNPYADSDSDTLADVAMHFYESDLHALANKVPIRCAVDENPGQHMVTYTVAFGVTGALDPSTVPPHPQRGYAQDCPSNTATAGAFAWNNVTTSSPDSGFSDAQKIDDLVHAAYNGRGLFLSANDPTTLSSSLTTALNSITDRIGAAAAVTFNSSTLTGNSRVYQARFNSTQWSGELLGIPLDATGTVSSTPDWEAGAVLDARDLGTDDRAIITSDGTTAATFRWASLTTAQKNDLKTNSTGGTDSDAIGQARLAYLRGDRSCEIGSTGTCATGKTFRTRATRLGDLINSVPLYVETPRGKWPEEAPFGVIPENYSAFKNGDTAASSAFSSGKNASDRTAMLYAGANDGMLHAFNALTGDEVFAYVPSSVYDTSTNAGLHKLSESGYIHNYYVDLPPTVVDAYIDPDADNNDNWHTVLVGGLRGGGRSLFALDITDPDYLIDASTAAIRESRAASKVMWEFDSSDDADLGYTYSRPSVVPLGTSSGVEWYVVFGNGYNATNTVGTTAYAAKLFILKLEGPGADNVWDLGTDYWKIDTEVGTSTDRNGLSTPVTLDNDRDGITDRAYAGDLYGNLWAFDLSGSSGWSVAYTQGTTPKPLFTATDGDGGAGNKQPITVKPVVVRHPSESTVSTTEPNLMIFFGTGQYLTSADIIPPYNFQTFYGVWDEGTKEMTVDRTTPANSALVQQTYTQSSLVIGGRTVFLRTMDSSAAIDYSQKNGWFIDFTTDAGERIVVNPKVRGDTVFFNTLVPSANACDSGGDGWQMVVNLPNGGVPLQPVFDVNGDGYIDENDTNTGDTTGEFPSGMKVNSIPSESSFIGGGGGGGGGGCPKGTQPRTEYIQKSDGTLESRLVCTTGGKKTGRFSWRQVQW